MEEHSEEALGKAVDIVKDTYGRKIVLINDIRFKGKKEKNGKMLKNILENM